MKGGVRETDTVLKGVMEHVRALHRPCVVGVLSVKHHSLVFNRLRFPRQRLHYLLALY